MEDAYIVHLHIIGHALVHNAGGKDYVTYIIDLQQGNAGWQIFRRFASFVALNQVIREGVPHAPPCPPKKVFGRKTPEFLEQRRAALEKWLRELLGMGEVCAILEFQHFLQLPPHGMGNPVMSPASQLGGEAHGRGAEHSAIRRGVSLQDFVLIKVIGKGSFGKVLLVRKRDTGAVYAMKVLRKKQILRRNQIEHTITERNVLTRIDHPFVVGLKFAFQSPEKLYFVLDYCAGGELFYHLGQARRFGEDRARFYAAELTLALGHMHQLNVIYRDLKPENVLIDADGHLRLTDFGLSKENVSSVAEGASSFCGTPEYLAPEVLARTGHGRAVDWWSLGALLYEMLTGLPPFYSRDREVMFDKIRRAKLLLPDCLSPEARDVLVRLLRRDPRQRLGSGPTDAEEVRNHPFFASVHWDALLHKRISPPWVPPIRDGADTSQFSTEFTALPVSTPGGGTLPTGTTPLLNFQGFTYVHPTAVGPEQEEKLAERGRGGAAAGEAGREGKEEEEFAGEGVRDAAAGRAGDSKLDEDSHPYGGRGGGGMMEEEYEEEAEDEEEESGAARHFSRVPDGSRTTVAHSAVGRDRRPPHQDDATSGSGTSSTAYGAASGFGLEQTAGAAPAGVSAYGDTRWGYPTHHAGLLLPQASSGYPLPTSDVSDGRRSDGGVESQSVASGLTSGTTRSSGTRNSAREWGAGPGHVADGGLPPASGRGMSIEEEP